MASDYFIRCVCVASIFLCYGVLSAPMNAEKAKAEAEESHSVPSEESMGTESQPKVPSQADTATEKTIQTGLPLPPESTLQESDQSQISSDKNLYGESDIDLTPQAVAEYLLLSGDFAGFDEALMDLVRAQILTPLEVARYKRVVGWEYENLLRQMLEAEANYLEMFAKPILENLVLSSFVEPDYTQSQDTSPDKNDTNTAEVSATENQQADGENEEDNDNNGTDAGKNVEEPIDLDFDALFQAVMGNQQTNDEAKEEASPKWQELDTEKELDNLVKESEQ